MKNKWKLLKERNYGIMTRIVICFTVLVIIPYLIVACLLSVNFLKYSLKSTAGTTESSLEVAADRLSYLIRDYENTSMMVYYNGVVDSLPGNGQLTVQEKAAMQNLLNSMCYSGEGIRGIYLCFQDQIYTGGKNYSTVSEIVQEYEDVVYAAKGRPVWFASNQIFGAEEQNRYIMARVLNDPQGNAVAVFYMLIDGKQMNETLEELSGDVSTTYLVAGDGSIFYSSDPSQLNQKFDTVLLQENQLRRNEKVIMNHTAYQMVERYLPKIQWHCISMISVDDVRMQVLKVELPFLIIGVCYGVFLLLMLYFMRRYIFAPLSMLNTAMEQYAREELETVKLPENGIGEFKNLSLHFNEMTQRILELMEAYKAEEEEKNRQKIQTLTAQLTPHFIYNALNTIKWMAVLNHQENIQHLVESLVYIFMNAARVEDEQYSFGDELELIENYAVIQKARFMNFELETEIEPDVLRMHVRKLFLQPIVENSIVHGLKRGKIKNTKIQIKAWQDGDIYIEVHDEGVGFDVHKWREKPASDKTHTHIGLKNVEEMMRLEYGDQYGMEIESMLGKGTTIRYHLPAILVKEVTK